MKHLILVVLSLVTSFSVGAEPQFPKNWCMNDKCSPQQKEIWQQFEVSTQPPDWSNVPFVMSGSCYHTGSIYDNAFEHHGGFLIDVLDDDGMTFNGRFSFFAKQNPYVGMPVEEARKQWKKEGDKRRVETYPTYGYFDATPQYENKIWYWMRKGTEPGQILMATFFSGGDFRFALCDLRINEE